MPTIHNWEEWDDVEDRTNDELTREKLNQKPKTHNKKEWKKIDEQLQRDNNKKNAITILCDRGERYFSCF